jgi:hypothetical protein
MMIRPEIDWQYVTRHSLLPAVTAVVAIALLASSIWLHSRQEELFKQITVNHGAMHEDYDSLVYKRRLVDRYHRRYEDYHEIGFVGRESRLDWIETLRESSLGLTIPRVSYSIEPQLQVVAPIQSTQAGENIQIHLSRLRLEAGLVHELDLLRLVDELQSHAPGLINIDGCRLVWQASDVDRMKVSANIVASCSVQIFSLITSDVDTVAAAL